MKLIVDKDRESRINDCLNDIDAIVNILYSATENEFNTPEPFDICCLLLILQDKIKALRKDLRSMIY